MFFCALFEKRAKNEQNGAKNEQNWAKNEQIGQKMSNWAKNEQNGATFLKKVSKNFFF